MTNSTSGLQSKRPLINVKLRTRYGLPCEVTWLNVGWHENGNTLSKWLPLQFCVISPKWLLLQFCVMEGHVEDMCGAPECPQRQGPARVGFWSSRSEKWKTKAFTLFRGVQSEKKMLSLFFEKCKVKKNAFTLFREVKNEIKMLRYWEVKILENF